jgi:hypothetical protein
VLAFVADCSMFRKVGGHGVAYLVEVLCYKAKGFGFVSR